MSDSARRPRSPRPTFGRSPRRTLQVPERLMVAWQEARPSRGCISNPWWETAILLAAFGPYLSCALNEATAHELVLRGAVRPPRGGVWVWEGRPHAVGGPASPLDLTNGEWRAPTRREWQEARELGACVPLSQPLRLKPAPDSTHQRIDAVTSALERYPAQCGGTPEAREGHVLQLLLERRPHRLACTLTELHAITRAFSMTIVTEDGEVDVLADRCGWRVEEVRGLARLGVA
jgi:hypothetical protein